MKLIPLHTNEKLLIKKAIAQHKPAQRYLYEKFAPKMLSVCRQYIKDLQFAEDAMVSGFAKVFQHLASFRHEGSFEGWIRKIMVRESISYLRKKQFVVYDNELFDAQGKPWEMETAATDMEQLQQLIDALPEGYKMVFLLYAVEGYKHREIATMLQISEGTSKSQLSKARKLLQERLMLAGIRPRTKQCDA